MKKLLAIICILLSVATILSLASCTSDDSDDSDSKKEEKAEKLPGGKHTKLAKLPHEEFSDEDIFFAYPEGFTKYVDEYENCIWFESTDGSFCDSIPTGLDNGHTLGTLFKDIVNGNFAGYVKVFGKSLLAELIDIRAAIDEIKTALGGL